MDGIPNSELRFPNSSRRGSPDPQSFHLFDAPKEEALLHSPEVVHQQGAIEVVHLVTDRLREKSIGLNFPPHTIGILGASEVFADVDPDSFNLDPQRVEDAITPRTRPSRIAAARPPNPLPMTTAAGRSEGSLGIEWFPRFEVILN